MASNEYCDSDGSDVELGESGEFGREVEVEGFVPDDPLDRAQEWEFWVEGEEEDDEDFAGFQVDWTTDGYMPRNPRQFTQKRDRSSRLPWMKPPLGCFHG